MKGTLLLAGSLGIVFGATIASPPGQSQDHVQRFVDGFAKFMSERPEDGRFGISRLPSIHNRQVANTHGVPEAFQTLSKDHYLGVFALGKFKNGVPERFNTQGAYWDLEETPSEWFGSIRAAYDANSAFVNKYLKPAAGSLLKMKRNQARFEETYVGNHKVVIEARKIFASDDSCYKCHADTQKGQPIGIIGLARIKR
ncbi:MAG: hypothetical protein WCK51_07490 [Armatimonadota bacterium]